MRRRVIGAAAVGAVLALATATGVSAYWQAQQRLDLGTTAAGDLKIDAAWKTPPNWAAMYPGDSREGVIVVTPTAHGQTLGWRLRVTSAVAPSLADHVAFRAWEGACGGPTPIAPEGNGPFGVRTSFEVCVRYTLDSTTPRSMTGLSVSPVITVTAEQASS